MRIAPPFFGIGLAWYRRPPELFVPHMSMSDLCLQMNQIQQSIAECGWREAATIRQQDPSEVFTFITDTLQLPLLTVKVDIAHGGKEVVEDDHKFISERLLNVALPDEGVDSRDPIPLEVCLEGLNPPEL